MGILCIEFFIFFALLVHNKKIALFVDDSGEHRLCRQKLATFTSIKKKRRRRKSGDGFLNHFLLVFDTKEKGKKDPIRKHRINIKYVSTCFL